VPGKGSNHLRKDAVMKEKGFVMVLCLLMLLVVMLLAITGMQTATFGTMIAGNGLESQKAFWIADSGLQNAKNKLDQASSVEAFRNITGLSSPVSYGGGTYTITTATDPYDSTRRVVVTSVGSRPEARKTLEATLMKLTFGLEGPGALYSKSLVTINGNKTFINGNDPCGGSDKPAIVTTVPNIVFQNGNLDGNGNPTTVTNSSGLGDVTERSSPLDIPLVKYINAFKDYAPPPEITDASIEGSKVDWGMDEISLQPDKDGVPQRIQLVGDPKPNVIYLNPPVNPGNGIKEVSLQGVGGHGLLLIDGSANISGGFNWYGLVIASGGVKFTGQGGEGKNITGAVWAGETGVVVDINVTGSIAILYCSGIINYLNDLSAVIMLSWRELRN
jgi:PilX N-terminal